MHSWRNNICSFLFSFSCGGQTGDIAGNYLHLSGNGESRLLAWGGLLIVLSCKGVLVRPVQQGVLPALLSHRAGVSGVFSCAEEHKGDACQDDNYEIKADG